MLNLSNLHENFQINYDDALKAQTIHSNLHLKSVPIGSVQLKELLQKKESYFMNPKLDEVKEWLLIAEDDLISARILLNHEPPSLRIACFLCQQSILLAFVA